MQYLKQSTATTLKIGPFIDDTDGKTAETGLDIAQADVRLSKNGGNIAQKTEATSCTHDELGIYGCPIDATDTATLGRLQLWVSESGALPVWHEFIVIPANVYDSLFSTDKLQVDLTQCGGSVVAAGAIPNAAADAAGGLPISDAGALDLDTKLANTNEITVARMGALTDWINGGRLDLLLDAIPTTAMRGTDSAALATALTTHDGKLDTVDNIVDGIQTDLTNATSTILEDTNELQTDWANGGRLDLILDIIAADTTTDIPTKLLAYAQLLARSDAAITTDNATELTAINADGGSGAGDFANQTEALEAIRDRGDAAWTTGAGGSAPTVQEIRQEMDTNSVDLNAILTDTNELQTNQGNWATATGFNTVVPDVAGTLASYDPPTRTEATADKEAIIADLLTMKKTAAGAYDRDTDSLEAIRDRGDAAWVTGAGGSAPTVGEIRTEMEGAGHKLAIIEADTNELQTNQADWATATGFSTVAALATAQADLDKITGADGATLATAQALYAPNKVIPDVAGTAAGLHSTTDGKIDTVDANVDAILVDTSATLPASIAALNDLAVADIIAGITDDTLDLQEMMRIILAATAGKSSGGGTVTLVFRDAADSKARITATVDATGNRTAMTLDGA